MNRNPQLPLTETVYYILLALMEPAHGYVIMARVESMSDAAVRLAPGTLYGALENLVKQRLIVRVDNPDPRRKVYIITQEGHETLAQDTQRMAHMVQHSNSSEGVPSTHENVQDVRRLRQGGSLAEPQSRRGVAARQVPDSATRSRRSRRGRPSCASTTGPA